MKKDKLQNIFETTGCIPDETLLLYVDNRLEGEEKHRVERHLVDCVMCSDFVEGVLLMADKEKIETVVSAINDTISSGPKVIRMNEGVMQKARRRYFRYAAAVALLILIGGGLILIKRNWEKPNREIAMIQEEVAGSEKKEAGSGGDIASVAALPRNDGAVTEHRDETSRDVQIGRPYLSSTLETASGKREAVEKTEAKKEVPVATIAVEKAKSDAEEAKTADLAFVVASALDEVRGQRSEDRGQSQRSMEKEPAMEQEVIVMEEQAEAKKSLSESGAALGRAKAVAPAAPAADERNGMIKAEAQQPQENPYKDAAIEVKTFKDSLGWGYDVYINESRYVHQPNIPAVSGNRGFSSESFAKKTGEFVAYKIRNNIMPPSVTPEELDSLGVLK